MGEQHTSEINLKEKIIQVLAMKNYTYAQMAEYLGISEAELDKQFEERTLEVRTLELISKALRIPLYSFFRDLNYNIDYNEELYYNVDIWGKEGVELRTTLKKDSLGNISDDDMLRLKNELAEKERLIRDEENKKKK